MLAISTILAGLASGFYLRDRITNYSRIIRLQFLLLVTPTSFLAGWVFNPSSNNLLLFLGMCLADCLALGVAATFASRDRRLAVLVPAALGSTGVWAMPLAAILYGPAAVALIAAYDIIAWPRAYLLVFFGRRFSPQPQTKKSGIFDYAPKVGLIGGLLFRFLLGHPPALFSNALVWISIVGGAVSFAFMAAGLPRHLEKLSPLYILPVTVFLRFGIIPPFLLLLGLQIEIPPAAWLLTFSPCLVGIITQAKLYGYSTSQAVWALLITAAGALVALPFFWW